MIFDLSGMEVAAIGGGAVTAMLLGGMWVAAARLESLGAKRFERDTMALAIAEARWWVDHHRKLGNEETQAAAQTRLDELLAANPAPAPRRWNVGEVLTRVAGRVADMVLWAARIGARR